jgi:acetyltransferase-like isoleucine patch superfamily enzyme
MEGIKNLLKQRIPAGSIERWLLSGLYSKPLQFPFIFLKSLFATHKLTRSFFPIRVRLGTGQHININRAPSSKVFMSANLIVNQWGGNNLPSSITCAEESTFTVMGDFELGPGVHITIGRGASLILKGCKNSTASGITCNTRIMVEKSIDIGADCIIAWDVLITDSDWHEIKGVERAIPVFIGDNVWITHGVSITKGAKIPSGCIVGAKSLITKSGQFKENSLIAGIPAVELKTDIEWTR